MKKINKDLIGFYIYKYKWYLLCYLSLFIIALITGKLLESIALFVGFIVFRYVFPSTLHIDIFEQCIYSSIFLLGTGIIVCFSKNISIYSSAFISFILCLILYIIDYVISIIKPKIAKSNRDKIIELLNGDTSQDNIFLLCRNCGLKDDVANSVDLFLTNTLEETAEILEVDVRTIQRRIKKFIEECSK